MGDPQGTQQPADDGQQADQEPDAPDAPATQDGGDDKPDVMYQG